MNKSPFVKFMFVGFAILVGAINAALTAVFSYTYLPAAFGDPEGLLAGYTASSYGLLIMDVAYVVWFWMYLRLAESKGQRSLTLAMAILSLGASIMATITQLATNAFDLVDLTAYTQTVGIIALASMIVVTALHITSFAVYTLLEPEERVKSKAADLKANMLESALAEMEQRIGADASIVVDAFAAKLRRDVLRQLGFSETLIPIGQADQPPPLIEADYDDSPEAEAARQREYARRNQEYARRNKEKAEALEAEAARRNKYTLFINGNPADEYKTYTAAETAAWFAINHENPKVVTIADKDDNLLFWWYPNSSNPAPVAPSPNGGHPEL